MKLNIQAFLNSLVFMGEGMLGIFCGDGHHHRRDICARPFHRKEGRINLNGSLTPRKSEKMRLFQKRWTGNAAVL